ncbi:2-oxo-4-hydroxy-4-carboxy-5-ureidoimidazoline decarboxylase [Anatilimnocola floriformis]|uniref:2-oxo-4-hydroxy-4-carboxy-5-ureidoimidazoline decarboxylase n=1 Tax=Anatilimnocola floriformis TaxID=2948575 RepID=UPI0020C5A875|nr:2-oxo-4-hydroxy-4-carboxy-5-ureidoimidazoline decarboxylase [Anatilimnocola floriformis]
MNVASTLNSLDAAPARDALQKCCAAPQWAEQMLARRPFATDEEVTHAAVDIWWSLNRNEWLAAFAAHPKIGDPASLRAKYANTSHWASNEQAGVAAAAEQTLQELADYNQRYEQRFGYIFIVCATGKSAAEMLALLKGRIDNDAESEIKVAAGEQLKITLLRLQKV